MDSNVSRKTFGFEFFYPRFTGENWGIQELLKQVLLRTIKLYGTTKDIELNLKFIADALDSKIVLLQDYSKALSAKNQFDDSLLKSKLTNIVYRCAIAFPLANCCQLPAQNVAIELVNLFPLVTPKADGELYLELVAKVVTPGWIEFYLSQASLAIWLQQLPTLLAPKLAIAAINQSATTTQNLFPLQYVHARCCALLRLGEREQLIQLRDRHFNYLTWHIASPNPGWELDFSPQTEQTEYELLFSWLAIIDVLSRNKDNWLKLGMNLSQALLNFEAKCSIFGAIKRQNPHQAVFRLTLVALAQYCLQNLLEQKIGIKAIAYL